jgi:CHAD domain-containing protein
MDAPELVHGRFRALLKAARHLDDGRSEASVHKMRVILRRLDALFGLLKGAGEDRRFQKVLRRQKKLRKRLGRVRDLDVLLARWREWADGRPFFRAVDREVRRRREKALRALLKKFDPDKIRKTARRMEKAVAGRKIRADLPSLVRRILSDRELHEVRLDVKRLRYSLEQVAELGNRPGGRDVAFLKELQAELGRMNDLESLARYLAKLLKKKGGTWSRAAAAGIEKVADEITNRLKTERHLWDKQWPERRQRLKGMAA